MSAARASISSQVVPHPLILSSSMPRQNSDRKRDSGIGGLVHRLSNKRSSEQDAPADSGKMPVYRLYPHQNSDGRRELRAVDQDPKDRPQSSASHHRNRSKLGSIATTIHVAEGNNPADHPKRLSTNRQNPKSATNSRPSTAMSDAHETPNFADAGEDSVTPLHATARVIQIPARTSSSVINRRSNPLSPAEAARFAATSPTPTTPDMTSADIYASGARSSSGSVFSQDTEATSIHTLPPLQSKGPDNSDAQYLEPVIEDDPGSWDLVAPAEYDQDLGIYALEKRAEQLLSAEHLQIIFDDPKLLLKFTGFLNTHRAKSIPILIYYLDALKAIRAINYANAIAEALDPIKDQDFTQQPAKPTINSSLEEKASRAFQVLVQEDLPAFVAHTWIQVVSVSIQRRITGTLAPHLREASEGLAEVFCLTDPSRTDNPIVFASEEFARTTQYGMSYAIGRNCRFLQGPRTDAYSVRRLAEACIEGKELTEVFVNYRRDGSPFLNLLMIAPLMDSRGNIRYFIGAQVDVSGLLKDCAEMDGLRTLIEKEQDAAAGAEEEDAYHKDEFQELSEMFNGAELETVRKSGGRMHKEYVDDSDHESLNPGRPRLLLKDSDPVATAQDERSVSTSRNSVIRERINGKLEGVYQNYLLIRPAPSLRILFTSPSLRVPGILQSPFLNRIGGSPRVRSDLRAALGEGRGVTAKIRWLTRPDEDGEGEGRPRWIHCTPLLGHSGAVGVWMVVLVDEESTTGTGTGRRFRQAPPVSNNIGGKEWDGSAPRDKRFSNIYTKDDERRGANAGHGTSGSVSRPTTAQRQRSVDPASSEFSFNLKG